MGKKIGAVVLAAGEAKRMGQPKQFLPLNGAPMFIHSIITATRSGLSPIILVVGSNEDKYRDILRGYQTVRMIKNPSYVDGMGTSLKLGIEAVGDAVDGVMVFLADQPFVPTSVIKKMVVTFTESNEQYSIIRPVYSGTDGHPIFFSSGLFSEFSGLSGDIGGKRIIKKYQNYVKKEYFESNTWGFDLDTPDDYEKALGWLTKQKKVEKQCQKIIGLD
ncbi:Putative acyltransferase [Mycobacteroides abscessus subsp. abscessus]|nr:Putative acyltransferase [Mycobacteroides abscessus subsp. abscessus]